MSPPLRLWMCVSLALGAATLTGCNWVGALVVASPDPLQDARFILPQNARVLVMLDERRHQAVNPVLRPTFEEVLGEELTSRGLVASVAPQEELDSLKLARSQDFHRLSVQAIGRQCGADVVISCELLGFRLHPSPGDAIWEGYAQVAVRVVDVRKGELMWPAGQDDGESLTLKTPPEQRDDRDFADQLSRRVGRELAEDVAKLFYQHKSSTVYTARSTIGGTQE